MALTFTRRHFIQGAMAFGVPQFPLKVMANEECKRLRGLVVLIEFPGTKRSGDTSFAKERFRKLSYYVKEMSYGKVCVDFDFTQWLSMPDPISQYNISPANLKVDKSRVTKLIQDAIDGADEAHDFSEYDYMIVYMGARFQEYGMVGLCGYPGMLGWKQELVFKTSRRGQVVPNGVAIFTVTAHLGTLFHDSAHVWGGVVDGKRRVPCLYDHDLQEQHPTVADDFKYALINMGYWDPMSCHLYQYRLPPPGISAWTKLRLGWLPPENVKTVNSDTTTEVVLAPLESASTEVLAIRIPISSERYILIENRQPIGMFDSVLPSHGVLIMKADDSVAECRFGRAPVKLVDANPGQKFLMGAAFDVTGNSGYVDAENNIEIRLLEKIGMSYRVAVRRHS